MSNKYGVRHLGVWAGRSAGLFVAMLLLASFFGGVRADEGEGSAAASGGSSVLVARFSATGNTGEIAEVIAEHLHADRFEICPAEPYSAADLDYNSDCRANREQDDPDARPPFVGELEHPEQYDVIFLGYPIWWGKLPKIMYTFLEQNDFSGKTVIPFCTSASSGIGASVGEIRKLQPAAAVNDGRRFAPGTEENNVMTWLDELNLPVKEASMNMIGITCGDHTLSFVPEENLSAAAFVQLLQEGAVTVVMGDYGDFEKVGDLGGTLPRSDTEITVGPGDVILYQGASVTIYYGENSWCFTRLGTIPNMTRETMLEFFGGAGQATVVFSLIRK